MHRPVSTLHCEHISESCPRARPYPGQLMAKVPRSRLRSALAAQAEPAEGGKLAPLVLAPC